MPKNSTIIAAALCVGILSLASMTEEQMRDDSSKAPMAHIIKKWETAASGGGSTWLFCVGWEFWSDGVLVVYNYVNFGKKRLDGRQGHMLITFYTYEERPESITLKRCGKPGDEHESTTDAVRKTEEGILVGENLFRAVPEFSFENSPFYRRILHKGNREGDRQRGGSGKRTGTLDTN